MTSAPTLTTERLILRAQRVEDFEPFAAMLATDRSKWMGGPCSRKDSWLWFASDSGAWDLLNMGGWTIERREDGAAIGQIGCNKPDFFPEVELGWMLYDGFEGQGYAFEAACAARDWAFATRDLPTLVSYVSPENTGSIRLAERMGAVRDNAADRPEPEDLVYRHPHPAGDGGMEAYA